MRADTLTRSFRDKARRIALGPLLLQKPWEKMMRDFDPRIGNYLAYGLLLLAPLPYLVMKLRGQNARRGIVRGLLAPGARFPCIRQI
jgi:hypothetical protein